MVLNPVSGLVGLDPRDLLCDSKAGLRHLSWNNSGSSATAAEKVTRAAQRSGSTSHPYWLEHGTRGRRLAAGPHASSASERVCERGLSG